MKDYYPEWLKIAEKLDQLDSQKKKVVVSQDVYMAIHRLKINLFGLIVQSSPLFPFETHWDACDIDTHQKIQIPSGEWIHGVMMSPMGFNDMEPMPFPIQWQEQDTKNNWLKGRMF